MMMVEADADEDVGVGEVTVVTVPPFEFEDAIFAPENDLLLADFERT